jgi:hypothetical protein
MRRLRGWVPDGVWFTGGNKQHVTTTEMVNLVAQHGHQGAREHFDLMLLRCVDVFRGPRLARRIEHVAFE